MAAIVKTKERTIVNGKVVETVVREIEKQKSPWDDQVPLLAANQEQRRHDEQARVKSDKFVDKAKGALDAAFRPREGKRRAQKPARGALHA